MMCWFQSKIFNLLIKVSLQYNLKSTIYCENDTSFTLHLIMMNLHYIEVNKINSCIF